MRYNQLVLLFLLLVAFSSCENGVSYEGTIVDQNTQQALDSVKILVLINNTIQEQYGVEVEDSLLSQQRDVIIKQNNEQRDGWSHLLTSEGKYLRFEPYLTDSLGNFNIGLHEACIFGCPNYIIKFVKEGYRDFAIIGDWKSQRSLKIGLKKNVL